jgi:TPR repeat protein
LVRFIVLSAIVALSLASAFAAPAAPPQRSEGEQLFQQGHYKEAMAWWTERAAQGDIESARRLGMQYMDGLPWVTERDYAKARQYHLQAAMGGERRSMMDLGTIHENGFGVPASMPEAARWYEWSAKYGYAPAAQNIGTMLVSGEAGRQDNVEAYMYFILVALDNARQFGGKPDFDKPQPGSEMAALRPRLTAAQLADAKSRAQKFVPLTGPLPASENH